MSHSERLSGKNEHQISQYLQYLIDLWNNMDVGSRHLIAPVIIVFLIALSGCGSSFPNLPTPTPPPTMEGIPNPTVDAWGIPTSTLDPWGNPTIPPVDITPFPDYSTPTPPSVISPEQPPTAETWDNIVNPHLVWDGVIEAIDGKLMVVKDAYGNTLQNPLFIGEEKDFLGVLHPSEYELTAVILRSGGQPSIRSIQLNQNGMMMIGGELYVGPTFEASVNLPLESASVDLRGVPYVSSTDFTNVAVCISFVLDDGAIVFSDSGSGIGPIIGQDGELHVNVVEGFAKVSPVDPNAQGRTIPGIPDPEFTSPAPFDPNVLPQLPENLLSTPAPTPDPSACVDYLPVLQLPEGIGRGVADLMGVGHESLSAMREEVRRQLMSFVPQLKAMQAAGGGGIILQP